MHKTAYFQGIGAYHDRRKERKGAEWGGQQSRAEQSRGKEKRGVADPAWRSKSLCVCSPASQPASQLAV